MRISQSLPEEVRNCALLHGFMVKPL